MSTDETPSQNPGLYFDQLVNHVDQVFWMIDPNDDTYDYISPQFEEIWGIPADRLESIPEDFLRTIHPEDRTEVKQIFTNKLTEERELEYRIERPDGSVRWIRDRVFPVENDGGETNRIAGVAEDVTERKETRRALAEREERFRQMAEIIDEVHWMTDYEKEEVLYINPASREVFGYSPAEIYEDSRKLYDRIEVPGETTLEDMHQRVQEGQSTEFTYRYDHPDNGNKWIQVKAHPIENEDGRVKQVMGVNRDITEQREAKRELELFRESMDRSGDAIFIFDPKTAQFIYANESACTNLGYTREQLNNMTVHDIDPNVADGTIEWDELVREVRQNGPLTLESIHQQMDGTVFPVEIQVDYLDVGDQARMVAIARDMTERKKEKRENELLLTLSRIVGESEDIDDAIDGLIQTICELEDCPAAELWKPTRENTLECRKTYQLSHVNQYSLHAEGQTMSFPKGEGLPGTVWEQKEPHQISNLYDDEDFPRNRSARKDGLQEALGLPLVAGEELVGVIVLFRPKRKGTDGFSVDRLQSVFKQLQPLFNRKRAEEELHRSEQRLELAEELADLGHWSISLPDYDVFWSDEVYRILGRDPSEPEPPLEEAIQLYHEDDREEIRRKIEQAIEQEEEFSFQLRIRRSDGTIRHVRSIGGPCYDDNGDLREIFGVFQDITDQTKTLQQLEDSERRFRRMAENIEQAFFLIAPDFSDVLYVNRACEQLYGVPREQQLNDPMAWMEHVHPEDAEEIRADMETQRKRPEPELPEDKDFRVIHPERGLTWLRTTMKTIENDDGEIVKIVGITSDVTEQKQAQQALEKSERRFRNLVENLDQVFWVTDPDFESFKYVSPRYEEWWGEPVEKVYDDKFSWTSKVHPEDEKPMREAIQRHIVEATDPEEYREFHQEFRVEKENGDWRWCYASGTPVMNDRGEVENVIGLVSDITESKQIQEQLSRSLEEKNFLLQEVHHRVKNNLQVLLGLLSLQARRVDSEDARVTLNNSIQRIQSMALIHEKLYNNDRLSRIDVKEYVTDLVQHIIESNARKDLTISPKLKIDVGRKDPETVIPCGLIINELVTNAVKHAFPGNGQEQITVEFRRENGNYRLSVSDSGKGVEGDLFDNKSLGLTLVDNLARNQLHGEIEVNDRQDGLTVSILFPEEDQN